MQRSEAAKLVATLSAAYRDAPISEETSQVYERMLLDLDFEAGKAAVQRLICMSKWLPTVAEIRAAAADIDRGPVRRGGEAFGDVLAEIRRTGSYGAPSFADPLVAECVSLMGWRTLCLGDNEAADRARFIELYDGLAARGRADVVAGRPLPAPRGGLALPSMVGRLLPPPASAAPVETVPAAEVAKALKPPAAPPAAPARKWTADELDAALKESRTP
jgi:hypothetical protein